MSAADIRQSLTEQLRMKGADVAHFCSLIDDYIWMYEQVQDMKKDIQNRGATYEAVSAAGKVYDKENPAVKNIVLYNRQMLAILRDLELSTDSAGKDEDDEL